MKLNLTFFSARVTFIMVLLSDLMFAQNANRYASLSQQDHRLNIAMAYQPDADAFGALTQDFKIEIANLTNDKLHIFIEYYADLVCGGRKTGRVGWNQDGYIMQPRERIIPNWTGQHQWGYTRILGDACPRDTWEKKGVYQDGFKAYNIIKGVGYRIIKVTNLSEQERQEKQKIEDEQRLKKAEADRKAKELEAKAKLEKEKQKRTENEKIRQQNLADEKLSAAEKMQRDEVEAHRRAEEKRAAAEEERRRIEREDDAKPTCSKSFMVRLTMKLEADYNSYKVGQMAPGSRATLMEDARKLLTLCPSNLTADRILNSLEKDQQMEAEMITAIFDNAARMEIDLKMSLSSRLPAIEEQTVGVNFGGAIKLHYGIPAISAVAAVGISSIQYPAYSFIYKNKKPREILPSDLPNESSAYDVGTTLSITGGIGAAGTIPIIKNKDKTSAWPTLGISLEALGLLYYNTINNDIIRTHFPTMIEDFTFGLSGSVGLSFLMSAETMVTVKFGMDHFFLKDEIDGPIEKLLNSDGKNATMDYTATIINNKKTVPYVGLGISFGL